jgi:hypothetical protein
MLKKIICLSVLLLAGTVQAFVIEDFENVSDWYVYIDGSAALDGSVAVNAANAQSGSYAGAFMYELSNAMSNNWIHFRKEFATPLDLSNPNLVFQMKINIPNDYMFVQVRLTDINGKFIEHYIGEGLGNWMFLSLPLAQRGSVWSSYGNEPDLSQITQIRIEVCGDGYGETAAGTVYLDDMIAVDQSYVVINDFEQTSWYSSKGPGATSASAALVNTGAPQGFGADAFTYGVSTATGSDYCDYYKDGLALNLSSVDNISMFIKMPNDPECDITLQIYNGTNGTHIEYTFPEGTGNWEFVSLPFSSFGVYGADAFDFANINLIRFRVIGDASAVASTNTFYVDYMTGGSPKDNCNLMFDSNGDCKINFVDFAAFALEWMSCGYDIPALCN